MDSLNARLQKLLASKATLEKQYRLAKTNEEKVELSKQLAPTRLAIDATEKKLQVITKKFQMEL